MSENIDIATGAIDSKPPIISYGNDHDRESKSRDTGDLAGIEAELADAGLRSFDHEMRDDGVAIIKTGDDATISDSEDDVRLAAEALAASRLKEEQREVREIKFTDNGEDADPDIALKSAEQAADVLLRMRQNDALLAEAVDDDAALAEYDMAEQPAEQPQTRIDQNEIANQAEAAQPPVSDTPVQSEQLPPDEDSYGQLAHAMRTNPAVRNAMVEAAQFEHQAMAQAKNAELVAAIRTVPEFANADLSQIGAIDQYIRAVNPQRAAQIDQQLGRIAADVAAVHQAAQNQTATLKAYQSQQEAAALNQRMRSAAQAFESKHNLSKEDTQGLSNYMSEELGLDVRDPFTHQLLANPKFYEASLKAYKYDRLQQAGLPRPSPKPAPQIGRPGPARGAAAARTEQSMQSLHSKLNSSGRLEDAMAILAARRRG